MSLLILILLSLSFVVTHIVMSAEPYRSRMLDKLGEMGFRGVYSLVSILTLGGAVWFYASHRDLGPVLWELPFYLAILPYLLMLLAIPMLLFSFLQRGPTAMIPGSWEVTGIKRVTRHPMNMSLALFGLAHLLAVGELGDAVFFSSFFIVGFFGAYHLDARKSRELGEQYAEFKSQTSVFPFAAILTGKNKLDLSEFNKPLLIASVVIYVLLVIFHGRLFGD